MHRYLQCELVAQCVEIPPQASQSIGVVSPFLNASHLRLGNAHALGHLLLSKPGCLADFHQLSLWDDRQKSQAKLQATLDTLRDRFGEPIIRRESDLDE